MPDATAGEIFSGIVTVSGEFAPTLTADILDTDGNVVVAGKTLTASVGGYLFSHVFTDTGLFAVKIFPTTGSPFVQVVRVSKPVEDRVWEYKR